MDLLRDYGIPAHVWFDNAKAFKGKRLVGRLPQKQTEHNQAVTGRGQKPAPHEPTLEKPPSGQALGQARHEAHSRQTAIDRQGQQGSGSPLYDPSRPKPDMSKPDVLTSGQRMLEQAGILPLLGVRVHRTLPYSGQSKPIERAFRDFCDTIAKHPLLAGAYTGNSPGNQPANYGSRAVSLELFRSVVDEGIREHNARPGRRTGVCGGKLSFDQAFDASFYGPGRTVSIRKATEEQRALCLPSVMVRLDSTDGSLRLSFLSATPACPKASDDEKAGSGGSRYWPKRYWAAKLLEYRGRYVTVRFDPDHPESVRVYTMNGSFLCIATRLKPAGFDDTKAAGAHARARQAFMEDTEKHAGG